MEFTDLSEPRPRPSTSGVSKWSCVPRLIQVLITALIGGLFALVVIVRSGKTPEKVFGSVVADPTDFQVCRDVNVRTGENMTISCELHSNHTYYEALLTAVNARAQTPDTVTLYMLKNMSVSNMTHWQFGLEGSHNVSCPWIGLWKITFFDDSGVPLYNGSFRVDISAPELKTDLYDNVATCSFELGCKRYDIVFNSTNPNTHINENKTCVGIPTYIEGMSLACSVAVMNETSVVCELHDSTVDQTRSAPIQTMALEDSRSSL